MHEFKMENIYDKNIIYSEGEIIDIATTNGMITVDCLKEDNQISVEIEGEENLFEFTRKRDNEFLLTWSYFEN